MSSKYDLGSRERAVEFPHLLSVHPYLVKKFPEMWRMPQNGMMYHYTDAQGLLGILGRDIVWATNYAFLNDPSERVYGLQLAGSVMDEFASSKSEVVRQVFASIKSKLAVDHVLYEYVASFCEDGDLLSQWRAYGGGAGGYSVGFNAQSLSHSLLQTALFLRVIYSESEQTQILKEICSIIAEHAEAKAADGSSWGDWMASHVAEYSSEAFRNLFISFKHPSYAGENEWRLVFHKKGVDFDENAAFDEDIKFRSRGSIIAPYVEIPFGEKRNMNNYRYPVEDIVIGPMNETGVCRQGIELLLKKKKRSVCVRSSEIPARKF